MISVVIRGQGGIEVYPEGHTVIAPTQGRVNQSVNVTSWGGVSVALY